MKRKLISVSLLSMGALTTSLAYTYKDSLGVENLSLFNKQEEYIDLSLEDIEDLYDNDAKQAYDGTPKWPVLKPGNTLPDDIYLEPLDQLPLNAGNNTMPYAVYQKSPVPGEEPTLIGEIDLTVNIIRAIITTVSFNAKIVTTNQLPYIYTIEGELPDEVIQKTANNANGILYKHNGKSQKAPFSFSAGGKYNVTYNVVRTTNYEKLDLNGVLYVIPGLESGTTLYDKKDHREDAKIDESLLPQGVKVSYEFKDESKNKVSELINAGVYTVIMYMSLDDVVISNEESTYTITKAPLSAFTLEEKSFVYDGEIKGLLIKENVPEGVKVGYVYKKDGIKVDKPTEAGEYDVTITVDGGNNYEYKEIIPTAKLTIERAEITGVSFPADSTTYDSNPHRIAVLGAPAGSTVVYTYEKDGISSTDAPTEAGDYTVTAIVTNGDNY
ncbi:MBG domain-containing protein, partial [Myroides sp. N17-2]|uniref:MBG domain-containing protein n=1 Tax=Myroides sp. N17-2 TaxID=2030799 RepID=UPI00117F8135